MIRTALKRLNPWGPALFGLGFLAPLIATLLGHAGLGASIGISPTAIGLLVGGAWGFYANIRGSWI